MGIEGYAGIKKASAGKCYAAEAFSIYQKAKISCGMPHYVRDHLRT
jgi:hypothetical protein